MKQNLTLTQPVCCLIKGRIILGKSFLLIALLVLSTFSSIVFAEPADDEYTLGLTLYGQKRWDLAIETFEGYLKNFSKHRNVPLAKLYLAQSYVNKENYKQARVLLRDFLKNHPKNKNQSQAMYRLSECSYFLDDYDAAIKEFEAFLKKSPSDTLTEWAFPYLANSYLHQGNASKAENVFRKSLTKFPKGRFLEDSHFGLARSLELLNKPEQAIAEYEKLINFPNGQRLDEATFHLGMLYFQQQDFVKTAELFAQLTQKYPQSELVPLAQLNQGYAFYSLKQWDNAKQSFEVAVKTPKYHDVAQYWLAQTFKAQGDFKQAEKLLQSLNQTNKNKGLSPKIQYQLAESQMRLNKHDVALEGFLDYLKQFSQEESAGNAYVHAVEICLSNSLIGQGFALTEKGLAAQAKIPQPQQRELQLLQAKLLTKKKSSDKLPGDWGTLDKRLKKSDKLLANLLKQTDKIESVIMNQQIRYQAAKTKKELGNSEQAIKILAPLTTAKPDDKTLLIPEAWLLLGSCLFDTQNYEQANLASQQLLKLIPQGATAQQGLIVQVNSLMELGQIEQAQTSLLALQKSKLPVEKLVPITYQLADAAYAKKEWKLAEKVYRQLLKFAPNDEWKIKTLSAIGWTQFEAAQFDQSAETFRSLSEQFPDSKHAAVDAGFMQGMAKLKNNETEQAAAIFLKTAQTFQSKPEQKQGNETHLIAYRCAREAARAYSRLSNVDHAAKGYKIAYEQLRKQPPAKKKHLDKLLDEWALLHYEGEQYEQADRIFALLIQETPLSDRADDAQLSLAESLYVKGEIKQARTSLEQLTTSKQADEYVKRRAFYQLMMLTAEQKDALATKKYADAYLKTVANQKVEFAESGEVELHLVQYHLDQKDLKQARTQIDQLIKKADASKNQQSLKWLPRAYVLVAEISRREKNYPFARQALVTFQKKFPDAEELANMEVIVGRTYIAEAKFDLANKHFKNVLDRAGNKKNLAVAQSQFYTAETALMQKDYTQAVKEYIRMAALYPGFPDLQSAAMYQAGQCDEVLGNVKQAIRSYQELIRLFPQSKFIDKAKSRIAKLKTIPAT